MQTINKPSQATSNLDKWQEKSREAIINNDKVQKIWHSFHGSGVYKSLREELLQIQGEVCCYCGVSLNKENCEIEHFEPKNFENVFDFNNLFISCSSPFYHTAKPEDDVEKITKIYSVDVKDLLIVQNEKPFLESDTLKEGLVFVDKSKGNGVKYVIKNKSQLELEFVKKNNENGNDSIKIPLTPDISVSEIITLIADKLNAKESQIMSGIDEKIPLKKDTKIRTGQKILIRNAGTCNNRKGDRRIENFVLTEKDLEKKFFFNNIGTMVVLPVNKNEGITNEINVILGLNEPSLCKSREEIIRAYAGHLKNKTTEELKEEYELYSDKKYSYSFVYRSLIRAQLGEI